MNTVQKVNSNVQTVKSDCLAAERQGLEDTRLTLKPPVTPNSKYVIMVNECHDDKRRN
jgi:hypothetical protein